MGNKSVLIDDKEISFRYSRSGGPGGQHSNKVNTRVELMWDISESKSLSESEKELLLSRLDPQVRIVVARFRSQKRNKDLAVEKLLSLVDANLKTNAKRVPTKPSVSVKRKRVEKKRKRGELKRQRRPIDFID